MVQSRRSVTSHGLVHGQIRGAQVDRLLMAGSAVNDCLGTVELREVCQTVRQL